MNQLRQIELTEDLYKYILDVSLREHELMNKLRLETYDYKTNNMQSSPEQVQFICFLAKLINAKNILEIGIYKGYSTLGLALSTAESAKIIACERNEEWADIAKSYWREANILDKIELKIGKAEDTLKSLLEDNFEQNFDMIFIDADKANYDTYYELSLKLLRKNGLIILDNVLWAGEVTNPDSIDKRAKSLDALNKKIKNDDRVDISLLNIRDGIFLILKK